DGSRLLLAFHTEGRLTRAEVHARDARVAPVAPVALALSAAMQRARLTQLAFSADGSRLLTTLEETVADGARRTETVLWDAGTGKQLAAVAEPIELGAHFTPGDRVLLTYDCTDYRLLDARSGAPLGPWHELPPVGKADASWLRQ